MDKVVKYLEEVEQITKLTVSLAIRANRLDKVIAKKEGTKEEVTQSLLNEVEA